MADQIVYSFTNFVLTALVARHASSHEFGVYSVLLASFLVVSATNRGLWAEPLIINFSTASEQDWLHASVRAFRRTIGFGLACGLVLAALTYVLLPADFSPLGYLFSIALPILFAQDLLRYAAFARGRPHAALMNDLSVAVVQVAAAVVVLAADLSASSTFVVVWIVAGLVGAMVGLWRLGLTAGHGQAYSVSGTGLDMRLGLDNAVTQLAQQGTGYAVAGVAGLAAAGGLRAGQTAYSPTAILGVGIQSAVIPELVRLRRRSLGAMGRAMMMVGAGLMAVIVVVAIVVPTMPDSIGPSLLGPSWNEARPALVYLGLGQIVSVPTIVVQAGLRALGDGRRTVHARLIGTSALLAVAIPLATTSGVAGAGIGIAVGGTLQMLTWLYFFRESFREQRCSAPEHN